MTLDKQMLRKAEQIVGKTPTPKELPTKRAKVEKPVDEGSMLFRGSFEAAEAPTAEDNFDRVTDEIQRWKYITPEEINEFRCSDGLLNEFKMFYHLRHRFPLHYMVFKQTACHLPHEANVEQYFSRAGLLSDPNTGSGLKSPNSRGQPLTRGPEADETKTVAVTLPHRV